MKRFLFLIAAVLVIASLAAPASAQIGTHPQTRFKLQDDSLKTTSDTWYFTITDGNDLDTSKMFSTKNIPLNGINLQFYRNDADTGDITVFFQQSIMQPTFVAGTDSAVAAINAVWVNTDTLWWAVAAGRKSVFWQPQIYPAEKGRIVIKHTAGGGSVVTFAEAILQE